MCIGVTADLVLWTEAGLRYHGAEERRASALVLPLIWFSGLKLGYDTTVLRKGEQVH
jgi:hypothetical protein